MLRFLFVEGCELNFDITVQDSPYSHFKHFMSFPAYDKEKRLYEGGRLIRTIVLTCKRDDSMFLHSGPD